MFQDSSSPDFTISCQGREFKVNSQVLASRCDFFRGCLKHGFAVGQTLSKYSFKTNTYVQEAESRVIKMDDDDPEALESFLKFLYTIEIDHIKYRKVAHDDVPEDWFSHIVKVFVLADKYDKPLLRDALASLINNEPGCDGWLQCPARGCPDHWLSLDESPFDVLEAYGATFEDDFPAVDDAPHIKRKLQKGLFDSIRRATLFMDTTPLEQMSDVQRGLFDRAAATFQKYNPVAFLDFARRSQHDLVKLDQEHQRLVQENLRMRQQVIALGGQP